MPQKKPPETESETAAGLESDQTLFAAKFAALLEGEFLRSIGGHENEDSIEGLRQRMVQSFVASLQETGARPAEVAALLQAGLNNLLTAENGWTDAMNDRRVELIDASLQRQLSDDESFELNQLTVGLRKHCDTADAVPMEGARKLHERLLGIEDASRDSD